MINFRWNLVIPKRFDFILLLFLLKVSDFETGRFISLLVQKFSSTLLCSLFPQLTFFYKSSKHWILYLYALVSFWIGCNESGRYLIVDPRKSDKALPIGFSSPRCTYHCPARNFEQFHILATLILTSPTQDVRSFDHQCTGHDLFQNLNKLFIFRYFF